MNKTEIKTNKTIEDIKNLPWQFSTLGIVLSALLSMGILLPISIIGNYQFKKGFKTNDLCKAYNILLIVISSIILLIIIFYITFIMCSMMSYSHNRGGFYQIR